MVHLEPSPTKTRILYWPGSCGARERCGLECKKTLTLQGSLECAQDCLLDTFIGCTFRSDPCVLVRRSHGMECCSRASTLNHAIPLLACPCPFGLPTVRPTRVGPQRKIKSQGRTRLLPPLYLLAWLVGWLVCAEGKDRGQLIGWETKALRPKAKVTSFLLHLLFTLFVPSAFHSPVKNIHGWKEKSTLR